MKKKEALVVESDKIILSETYLTGRSLNLFIPDDKKVLIKENFDIFKDIEINITIGKNCNVEYSVGLEKKHALTRARQIKVMAGSIFLFNELSGGKNHNSALEVQLLGEESVATVCGLSYAKQDETINIFQQIYHRAPKTHSQVLFSAVLAGKAKIKYDANIRMDTGMRHCLGGQAADFLLLSKHAKVETTPNLEIENNDVQCAHAVSIANLDNLKKFYLSSRGLNEKDTEKCLVEGHLARVLNKFPPDLKKQAEMLTI